MIDFIEGCYVAHYDALFGKPAQGDEFDQDGQSTPIRVIGFDGVIEECRTFCTLGLTRYKDELDLLAEVYVPVDGGWDIVDYVLANVLFELIEQNVKLRSGTTVNFGSAVPEFVERFGKSALYITSPFDLPEEIYRVPCGDENGFMLLGVFISESEDHFRLHEGDKGSTNYSKPTRLIHTTCCDERSYKV